MGDLVACDTTDVRFPCPWKAWVCCHFTGGLTSLHHPTELNRDSTELLTTDVAPRRSSVAVAAFLFSPENQYVVLIRKSRPAWQAGLLNGVGGKIEPGESAFDAVRREFFEEASLIVNSWTHFASISFGDYKVEFFRANSAEYLNIRSSTDEPVEVYSVADIMRSDSQDLGVVDNLRWLLAMALPDQEMYWPFEVQAGIPRPRGTAEWQLSLFS